MSRNLVCYLREISLYSLFCEVLWYLSAQNSPCVRKKLLLGIHFLSLPFSRVNASKKTFPCCPPNMSPSLGAPSENHVSVFHQNSGLMPCVTIWLCLTAYVRRNKRRERQKFPLRKCCKSSPLIQVCKAASAGWVVQLVQQPCISSLPFLEKWYSRTSIHGNVYQWCWWCFTEVLLAFPLFLSFPYTNIHVYRTRHL